MESRIIDIRGQVCPSSLLSALREINSNKSVLRSGELELVFLTDNRDATVTIPESATSMGYRVRTDNTQEGYRISVSSRPH